MHPPFRIRRTTTSDAAFEELIALLDDERWNELQGDQATHDRHNKVPGLATAALLYAEGKAVACGCFKVFDADTVEIKRMFVVKDQRGRGYSRAVLQALEQWAKEGGYIAAVLETSIHFTSARRLYESSGFVAIPNYPPYEGLAESVCLKKIFNR